MYELSILIPSRNEMFLGRTIEDIFAHIKGDTEVIAILDGAWPTTPIPDHPRLTLIHHPVSVGQRAATNEAARMSTGKYIMKVDAHCAFDKGFDAKMMRLMEPDVTMVPIMRNLHAFNWLCDDGHRRYQSPSGPCKEQIGYIRQPDPNVKGDHGEPLICGKPTTMEVVWIGKRNPQSVAYRFDKTMHFKYWNEYGRKLKGELTPTMSIQGSCFMVTREKYFELDLSSEVFNSWGQQGVEVACKTWLSGGRVMVNRTTWYAHLFRTQGGDFGFPYKNPESQIQANRELSRKLFEHDEWPGAIHKFEWLINKFQPPDWTS